MAEERIRETIPITCFAATRCAVLAVAVVVVAPAVRGEQSDGVTTKPPTGAPAEASQETTTPEPTKAPAVTKEAVPTGNEAPDTAAAIARLRQEAVEAASLDEKSKAEILELCDKGLAKLAESKALSAAVVQWQQEATTLQKENKAAARAKPDGAAKADASLAAAKTWSADEMRTRLAEADQRLSNAREQAQQAAAEIQHRAERRKALPEALVKSRDQLAQIEQALAQPATEGRPLLNEARRLCLVARREYRQKEFQSLEQENRTYEANARLWLAHRDLADKRLQAAAERHKRLLALAAKAQKQEAERQAREARIAAVNAHPAIKEAAAVNAEFAERNQELVAKTQLAQTRLTDAIELGATMQARMDDVKKREDAARNTPEIGMLLRSQQDQLPELGKYHDRLSKRQVALSQLGLEIYEWELLRKQSLHIDKAVEAAIAEIETVDADPMHEDLAAELRRVLESRGAILVDLIANANTYEIRLEELDVAERELVGTTEDLEAFIAEHVLWVRSAPYLSTNEFQALWRVATDFEGLSAKAKLLAAGLRKDAQSRPELWGFAALATVLLFVGRRRAKKRLKASGTAAAKPTATLFRPTVVAAAATIVMSLPIPAILAFLAWRLSHTGDGFPHSAAWAIGMLGLGYGELNLVRHASRPGGLGAKHFGWDQKSLSAIRHAMRSLQLLALPLLSIAFAVEISRNEANINSLGRISLISALWVIGVICFRLFRPTGALATALASGAKTAWSVRAVKILAPLSLLTTIGLIAASAIGYHYSAMQLTRRAFISGVFVFGCLALHALLMRWLLVAYRRVAMQHAREKRQALLEAQENNPTDTPVVDTQPEVSLSDINQQARRLVGVGAGLAFAISMWVFWGNMLPALGVFSRVELWESGLISSNPDVGQIFVTLSDLLLAIGIFTFTWFAGRNLPGLLEIAVLQKLPLDAGARYAASSVTRYVIMVVGVALGMRELGVGWQSVQWLIAAMTVGLGFGLQEIFANFVSGIILLFERPARVGDTVTIGTITGAVTKIRIRATTILDWDNKELIVPNKEFVTGNLVNWTLSNPTLRLVIKVGIAYGSDTRLATELLYRVAKIDPNVLDSPEPVVVFDEFGASSLDFQLRVFVSDLGQFRRLKHELHLAIDDLFKEHGIEIAFPQCDLHVRSLPAGLQGTLAASELQKAA